MGVSGVINDGYLDWDMIAPTANELAHVTSLQIYFAVGNDDQADRAGLILARTPALRYLDLELESYDIYDDDECCDAAVRILQQMFHRIESGQPTRLKSLRITSMCLLHAGMLLPDIMDLRMLEHLQLARCLDIDPFLRQLERFDLNLLSLCIEDFFRVDIADFAINDFIRSLKPLKRITLIFAGIWSFDLRTLQPHYSSLESVRIEGCSLEQAMVLASRLALNLEQLAMFGFKLEESLSDGRAVPLCHIKHWVVYFRMNQPKNIIVSTDQIRHTGHAQAPAIAQSPQTYNSLLFSTQNSHSNPDAVHATRTANSEKSCRTHLRLEAAKADSGGLCG